MNKVTPCEVPNCIPTPTSCSEWNGGNIDYLGICNGQSLNNIIVEIVKKLEDIAGEDISNFDLDSLLEICKAKAPLEVTLIGILNILRDNQLCLKDYIDTLSQQILEISKTQSVSVNLKCFADFDNLGNSLSITREDLDQLVINRLCNHEDRLESVEGKVISLQSQINEIDNTSTVEELTLSTCVNAAVVPTSTQVSSIAEAHCDLESSTGSPAEISTALSRIPSTDNTRYNTIIGWNSSVDSMADAVNNLLLKVANLEVRLITIETTCCAITCDDVKLGFTAIFNEDGDGIIIKFTAGAGTVIPAGFTDRGSTGTIKDVDGNVESFTLAIANNSEHEVFVTGLNLTAPVTINISAKIGTDSLICEKCLSKQVNSSACKYCVITASGEEGSSAVIVFRDGNTVPITYYGTTTTTTTTTSSTTTTTTAAP